MSFRTLAHQEFGAGKVLLVGTAAPRETECGLHVHVQKSLNQWGWRWQQPKIGIIWASLCRGQPWKLENSSFDKEFFCSTVICLVLSMIFHWEWLTSEANVLHVMTKAVNVANDKISRQTVIDHWTLGDSPSLHVFCLFALIVQSGYLRLIIITD